MGSSIFWRWWKSTGSAAALELALLDVRQLNSYARRVIVQQRPFATFADMAKRVNAGLPPTSCNRLTAKLAKHFRFDDGGARERNAEYGRELVGLNIHIPWSAWDGYPDGSGFETGTVFEYQSKHRPGRFVIAFPTAEEIDDISLSWEELLGETPCLASDAERVQLIWRDCASLTRQPAGRPAGFFWDMREAGWYDRNGQRKPELAAQAGAPPRPVQTCVRPPPSVLDVPVTVWMRTDEPDVFVELVEVDQIRLERARVKGGARFQRLRRRLRAERRRKELDYEARKCIPAEKAARGTERPRFSSIACRVVRVQ